MEQRSLLYLRGPIIVSVAAVVVTVMTLSASGDELGLAPGHPTAEFHFARLMYSDRSRSYGRGWGRSWEIDRPEAEYHFLQGVSRLTRVETAERSRILRLTDDAIFDHPWLYAVEVGDWYLSDEETERLREYLLRGGFMMVDDFHGPNQWLGFTETLNQVFPDRPIIDIPENDEVLHALYDLDQRIQIYGLRPLRMGVTYEYGGIEPHWRGVYDDNGRLMLAINHNMDLGDAWEHADTPEYPEPLTALAYRFAVNYVIYAMTH